MRIKAKKAGGKVSREKEILLALRRADLTLAIAESCTGGGLGEMLTRVPRASEVFVGGVIAYADDAKRTLLGVTGECLKTHGAVSRRTAHLMAEGVRRRLKTDLGLAITGIAGPGGGSSRRPVGGVWIALATAKRTLAWRHRFDGDRKDIRRRACRAALDHLRLALKRQ